MKLMSFSLLSSRLPATRRPTLMRIIGANASLSSIMFGDSYLERALAGCVDVAGWLNLASSWSGKNEPDQEHSEYLKEDRHMLNI